MLITESRIYPIVIHKRTKGRAWTEADDNTLRALHKAELMDLDIAAEMNRPAGVVSRHRRMMNLPANIAPPKPSGPSERGLSLAQVREITGSKPNAIEEATGDLGERLAVRVIRGEPVYVLDGRIGATVQMIIHAANKLRLVEGKPILGRVMP